MTSPRKKSLTPAQERDVCLARLLRDSINIDDIPADAIVVDYVNLFAVLEELNIPVRYGTSRISVDPAGSMFQYSTEINHLRVHGALISFTGANTQNDIAMIGKRRLMLDIKTQRQIELDQGKRTPAPDYAMEDLDWVVEHKTFAKREEIDDFDTYLDPIEVARLHAIALNYLTPTADATAPRRSL